jgi:hypothetical protein
MSGKRRNPALPGVSGITADDLAALDAGRITLLDIGTRCGISKQGAAKRIKAMRAASPAATAPASTSTGSTSIPAGAVLIDPAATAVSACLAILCRAVGLLEGPDQIGPTGLKGIASAVAVTTDQLRQLRVLTSDDDDKALTVLTVRTMTDEEHVETKRRVELPDDYED